MQSSQHVNYGGAISVGEGSDVTISNCSFYGNSATSSGNGGAISINTTLGSKEARYSIITHFAVSNNSAPDGADL